MTLPENSNTRFRLALLFAVPLAFSLLFFIVNVAAEHNDVRLLQMQELVSGTGQLQSIANDAEVGEHGFLLTGDDSYLIPLDGANSTIESQENLLAKTNAGPALQHKVDHVIALVRARLHDANRVIEMQREKGFGAAMDLAKSGNSEQIMQQIRRQTGSLQTELRNETSKYLDEERHLTHWAFLFFLVGTLVMLVVLIWLYNSFVSYIQARDSAHMQLQNLNADLERRIDERTKELKQFNEELQQFAYVASHDLQEPLRTITSFTQLLAKRYKGKLDEDADEFITYIVSSAHRMTDLINGLLTLVRLRKSGNPPEAIGFERLVEEAQVGLQAAIRENEARIEVGPLPSLVVDRIQVVQVFQNLISNAIKYRGNEPPRIRIDAVHDSSNWVFSVSDNGRGFDQQFAERIFGLFQRLHGREIDGTGMGLSICQRIVERHGGRMWAKSSEGVGSSFSFSLPVSLEQRAQNNSPASELAAQRP